MNQTLQASIARILKTRNQRDEVALIHQHIGDLQMPTGQLVACDPFLEIKMQQPFSSQLPCGRFPVFVSVESVGEFEFVRHAIIMFSDGSPVRWEMMTVGDQDPQQLAAGEYFGYPVDTGAGCFCDFAVIRSVKPRALKASFTTKMESSESNPFDVFNIQVGRANLIAFRSGFGDGIYGTFAAFDSEGRVSAVVTDF